MTATNIWYIVFGFDDIWLHFWWNFLINTASKEDIKLQNISQIVVKILRSNKSQIKKDWQLPMFVIWLWWHLLTLFSEIIHFLINTTSKEVVGGYKSCCRIKKSIKQRFPFHLTTTSTFVCLVWPQLNVIKSQSFQLWYRKCFFAYSHLLFQKCFKNNSNVCRNKISLDWKVIWCIFLKFSKCIAPKLPSNIYVICNAKI